jgi:flagellar hook-associated protein 1 FlgK
MTVNGVAGPASAPPTSPPAQRRHGRQGTAGFANGALTLTGSGGLGVAIADDATTPSSKAGKGFSQFFGLNDIVRSSGYSPVRDRHDRRRPAASPRQTITLRLTDVEGSRIRDVQVVHPPGPARCRKPSTP